MRRCEHGIYNPDLTTELAWGCTVCYPNHPEAPAPILPRSSGDSLNSNRTGTLDKCECGAIALSTRTACGVCGKAYPPGLGVARHQGTANEAQAGICPCGSAVHYKTAKSSVWECADCHALYPAPKGRQ